MKKTLLILAAVAVSGTASAAMPLFSATCGGSFKVDADRTQAVHINGQAAHVKQFSDTAFEARGAGIAVSITDQGSDAPIVSYSGRHGANGMCQVSGFRAASAAQPARNDEASRSANGRIPCAGHRGEGVSQCRFEVDREGRGTATVMVTLPDGRKRGLFFDHGRAVGADFSSADRNQTFHAAKRGDLFRINAGDEHYEIPDAVVFGG